MKSCTQKVDISSEALLMQLPGYVCARGLENNFLFGNKKVAELAGLSSPNKLEGFTDFDAPWANIANYLKRQDYDTYNGLKYKQLDPVISSEGFKVLLTTKSPFIDANGDIAAIIVMCMELTGKELMEIAYLMDSTSPFSQGPIIMGNENYIDSKIKRITQRECECLFYLLRGRSIKKIAQILSLSPRTVETYINNIKYKLGCNSKEQIIDLVNELGLYHYIPESLINQRLLSSLKD